MNRRSFLKTAGAGSMGVAFACGGEDEQSERIDAPDAASTPNIIYILADDLGYGDVGCYGQESIRTPNIDRLAAEGMRFTDHYAGSTVCAPSRCCLMTGLHTGHAYVRGNKRVPLPPGEVTVAELLKEYGYTTGIVGKWGLGEPGTTGVPNRQGFDYWFGYLNQRRAHNYYPDYLWRNEEKYPLEGNKVRDNVAYERGEYSHDIFTREALGFIENNSAGPFFLYLAYTIPHANNEAGNEGMEVPDDAPYSDRDWPQQQKNHAAMITRMDRDIGTVMQRLAELGIDDNTMVCFTSDNGPHREGGGDPEFFDANGPLRGIKRDLYEGGIRVPFIVRWPGVVAPGTTTGHPSAFWDFMPTVADITGTDAPTARDGISFLPVLRGDNAAQREHEYLYWEFHEGKGSKQAVRSGHWKAVRNLPSQPIELYDLDSDIGEAHDVAADNPDIVSRLTGYIDTARAESEHWEIFERS